MLKQVMTGLAVMGLLAAAAVAPATAAGKDKPKMASAKMGKKAMDCPHCHVKMKNGKCPKCGMTEAQAKKMMAGMHGKKGDKKMHGGKMGKM